MNWMLVIGFSVALTAFGQAESVPAMESATAIPSRDSIWRVVDSPAEFPGGPQEMMRYIQRTVRFPEEVEEDGLTGRVIVRFVVRKTGSISDVTILRGMSSCPRCDAEVIRVIQSMPRWIPGRVGEDPVDSYFLLPFMFQSND